MKEEAFPHAVQQWKDAFESKNKSPLKVIAPPTAEGITATAILIKALQRKQINFVLSFSLLTENIVDELSLDTAPALLLLDEDILSINHLENKLKNKTVFVITSSQKAFASPLIHLLAPTEKKEFGLAFLAYSVAEALDPENTELAHLVAPFLLEKGNPEWGTTIVELAKKDKLQREGVGFTLLSSPLQPLNTALTETIIPFFTGISGSEKGAVGFLENLEGEWRTKQGWKRGLDLTEEESRILTASLLKRKWGNIQISMQQVGEVWGIKQESEVIPVREWIDILSVCGKINQPIVALRICLGKKLWLTQGKIQRKKFNQEVARILESIATYAEKKTLKVIDQLAIWVAPEQYTDATIHEVEALMKQYRFLPQYLLFGILGNNKNGEHFLYLFPLHPAAQFENLIIGLTETFPMLKRKDGETSWYLFGQAKEEEILHALLTQTNAIRVEEQIQE